MAFEQLKVSLPTVNFNKMEKIKPPYAVFHTNGGKRGEIIEAPRCLLSAEAARLMKLDKFTGIEIHYDPETDCVGLRPTNKSDRDAVRKLCRALDSNIVVFSAGLLSRKTTAKVICNRHYPVEYDSKSDLFVIDLNRTA